MNLAARHKILFIDNKFRCLCTISTPIFQTLSRNSSKKPEALDFSLVSALKSISSSPSLVSHGQQLHCLVIKSGLNSNIFIQNSLMSMYSKCRLIACAKSIFDTSLKLDSVSCNVMLAGYVRYGHLNDARELFGRMPGKNCVSYTTWIMGLAQNEFYDDAVEVFREMRLLGLIPNEVTMASVISVYARIDRLRRGAMFLHGLMLKLGLDVFALVLTNLVHLYCMSSCVHEAKLIFDEIKEQNVVSCNVMLNGYAKAGFVDLAKDLFGGIEGKDVVSWGTLINGYLQVERLREALNLYCDMKQTGLSPNEVMIVDIISACGQEMNFIEGQQFHGIGMKMGFDCYDFMQATLVRFYAACREVKLARLQFELGNKDHVACWNALIAGLIGNGMIDEASYLFNEMPERDVFSWSTMISGYSQSEQPDLAVKLFHEMVAKGFQPNEITMVSVFSAISSLGTSREGIRAHDYVFKNSIPINDNLSAAIIDMYAKCGSIYAALEVFYQIQERAINVSPWNAIICGLAMHGHAEASLKIFCALQKRNIKLNSITYIGVLTACCHAGLVEAGEKHFQSMTAFYGLQPNIKHYGCMIDLLGRAGRLKEAEELIHSMPMQADVVIWGTLLAACKTHGNTDIGERAAQNLAKVEPSHGPSRVLLSNIYADAGRWDDAHFVRREVQSGKLLRSPGYSVV